MYIQYIQGLFQSRLGTADYALVTSSSLYHRSLDTWTVVLMTAAKFKPLIFWIDSLKSQSQSHVTTDGQSVSMSWCQVHSETCDQILFSVWNLLCCLCGAPSLTRGRVCLLSVTVTLYMSRVYVYAIYTRPMAAQTQNSRSCHNICSLGYNGSLDTWSVVRLTAAKFKPLIFSVLGFTLLYIADIRIFMILYDFCLLSA
jgi:hypothetical protein